MPNEIAGIERFADFYNRLGSATHNEYRTNRYAKVDSEESFNGQRQHLLNLYKDVQVQHSFVDAAGQIFDCIPINQQPALKKSGRPLATPPTLPVRRAPASPRAPTLAPLHPDRRDQYGNAMACPEGTVAVRRVTLDEMTRFEDLEHFLRKTPRHKRKRSPQLPPPPDASEAADPPHEYAHAYQTVNNTGGHSTLSIWDPAITGDQIFSLSQHWYVATTDQGLVQTAEVGWQVFPQKYGHSKPVLFTYWTADGYTSTGSYSNDNGDFVQYSSTCPVGLALEQVSTVGGAQAEIELSFILSNGNWWLYVNGADTANAVGYYPTALYQNGPLASGATEIDYGGETVGVSSYPLMGSGQFAAQGKGRAAYHRNIYLFPPGGGTQDADLQASQDWPQSYTIVVQKSADWGEYFFFGGPGSAAPAAPAPSAAARVSQLDAAAPPSPVSPAASLPAAPFDPADAVDYGLLIEAVYTMNANAAGSVTPPTQSDFPSEYNLTAWVQMKDFVLASTALKFYGVIAQSVAEPHRFVLALRGTEGAVEWLDNATSVWKTPFKIPGSGSVSVGFNTIYETMEIVETPSSTPDAPGAATAKPQTLRAEGGFSSQVAAHLRRRGPTAAARTASAALGPTETLDVAAHSLGGALATLYVMENASTDKIPNPILYTFASPMVGDATFVTAFNKLALTSWRIVNSSDVVPMLPSGLLGYQHVATAKTYSSTGLVQPNVGCWHAMATYLSLIDPTRAPDPSCALASTVSLATPRAIAPAIASATSPSAIDCFGNATAYLPHLKSIGVKAIGRYYSIYPAKVLSKKEAQLISQAGLDVFVVYEDGSAAGDFSSDSGAFAAQHALQLAANVGQPKGSAIYFAADFASDADQIASLITPYFQAIQAVFADAGSPYKIGFYGDGLACETLLAAKLCEFTWLSASTSYPGTEAFYKSKHWNLAQGLTTNYGGLSADPNEVNGEFGAFTLATSA